MGFEQAVEGQRLDLRLVAVGIEVPYRIHHAVGHDLVGGPGEEIDPGGGEPLEVVDPPLGGGIPRRRERL
jgi:hypothetical protein